MIFCTFKRPSEFTQFSVSLPSASPSRLGAQSPARTLLRRFSIHSLEVRVKQRVMSQSHMCRSQDSGLSSSPRAPIHPRALYNSSAGRSGSGRICRAACRGTCGSSINCGSVCPRRPGRAVSLQPDPKPPRLRVSLSARLSPAGTRAPLGRAVTCSRWLRDGATRPATARPCPPHTTRTYAIRARARRGDNAMRPRGIPSRLRRGRGPPPARAGPGPRD